MRATCRPPLRLASTPQRLRPCCTLCRPSARCQRCYDARTFVVCTIRMPCRVMLALEKTQRASASQERFWHETTVEELAEWAEDAAATPGPRPHTSDGSGLRRGSAAGRQVCNGSSLAPAVACVVQATPMPRCECPFVRHCRLRLRSSPSPPPSPCVPSSPMIVPLQVRCRATACTRSSRPGRTRSPL